MHTHTLSLSCSLPSLAFFAFALTLGFASAATAVLAIPFTLLSSASTKAWRSLPFWDGVIVALVLEPLRLIWESRREFYMQIRNVQM